MVSQEREGQLNWSSETADTVDPSFGDAEHTERVSFVALREIGTREDVKWLREWGDAKEGNSVEVIKADELDLL